jgi:hypothetical protein
MKSKFALGILIITAMLTFSGTCIPPLTPPPGDDSPARSPEPRLPTATQDQQSLPTRMPLPTVTESATGMIAGNLSYPSEWIPPLRVVAFDSATMAVEAFVDTQENDSFYTISLPVGTYYVVAYTMDGGLGAGYSQAVLCGLTVACTDHSLVAVQVLANMSIPDIDPGDWYAPPGTFPPKP